MQSVTINVGRCNVDNDVPVNDPSVSRLHLRVTVVSLQRLLIEDRQSRNGSFYWTGKEWQRFNSIELTANDYIFIGDSKLRLMEILIAYQIKHRDSYS